RTRAEAMLTDCPALLNARWIHDETVLHFLAIEGFSEGVRFLASRGADVNAVNKFGDTALVDIASLGLTEIADILLRHGADPNAHSQTSDNPLHTAARNGHADLVRCLLKAGANTQYRTAVGETLFDALAENPTGERAELLAALNESGVRDPATE
ncbi:MAG TPA: ankyrin repeat domain-containing protein, partial [Vicinamibacterales bacterium]|nr:ankyrin repeat domain-containing protein [Vicinamibacterales bacterium]